MIPVLGWLNIWCNQCVSLSYWQIIGGVTTETAAHLIAGCWQRYVYFTQHLRPIIYRSKCDDASWICRFEISSDRQNIHREPLVQILINFGRRMDK